jgi:hypothetical protein
VRSIDHAAARGWIAGAIAAISLGRAREGYSPFVPTSHLPGASTSPPPLCNELENPAGQVCVGIVANDTDTTLLFSGSSLTSSYLLDAECVDIAPRVSGYHSVPTDGDVLTFGASGFDLYALWNGQEFLRLQDYRHMEPGHATVKSPSSAGYGPGRTEVRYLPRQCLYSDYENGIYDVRDFGLRSTQATESMAA